MHLLPQLAEVERRFPDELVIIGVHAPKYPAERDPASLREAVLRNEVAHPVVNDAGMAIWQSYGVRAWPTLAFIDPRGNVVGVHEGEAPADALTDVVQQLVAQAEPTGILNRGPVPEIVPMPYPSGPLVFPEKVLADPEGDRLIIANSGRNQLVVARLDGSAARVIGSGEAGLTDGGAATARFHHPQGLALSGDTLYVADTRNHAIRQVSLTTGDVRTIAGTGHLGMTFMAPGPAREVDLRSPWDLALDDGTLYAAEMATNNMEEPPYLRPGSGRIVVNGADEALAEFAIPGHGRRLRVYFEEWDEPLISGIRWVSELIELAGGEDVFADFATRHSAKERRIEDPMTVVARAPDIIIGSWCGKKFQPDHLRARPGWAAVPAVANDRLHEIKSALILAPGIAALTDGLAALEACLDG